MIPFTFIAMAIICFIMGYGACLLDTDRGLRKAAQNAHLNLASEEHFHTLD